MTACRLGILLPRQESNLNRLEKGVEIVSMGDRLVEEVHQWKIWAETMDTTTQSSSFKHVPKATKVGSNNCPTQMS